MQKDSEQRIEVRPSTLANLVGDVSHGRYRIPQFQREYVWPRSKVIELLDSIYHEYPIGSFFIWKAGREHNDLFRHSVELELPSIRPDSDVSYVLDGQQRIVSLYVTLKGMTIGGNNYSRICFDLKTETFTYLDRDYDPGRYVPVCELWRPGAIKLVKGMPEEYADAFVKAFETLKTYPISIVEVRDKDLPAVCKIFQRINQAGKRLGRFDLVSAMTFSKDFDLREHLEKDIQSKLRARGFGTISPEAVTQLMALLKTGSCTERNEYALTASDVQSMWPSVVDSVLLAADTLRKGLGVMTSEYLPYDAQLTLLAYVYARSGERSLGSKETGWVARWFWRTSFGEHYSSGGPTKMARDRESLDRLIEGKLPPMSVQVTINAERLLKTKMSWPRSAIRNAFLCLLATRNPVHLRNNTPLDLVNGGISGFTGPEKHHLFPQAFLRSQGLPDAAIYALPNFCFLPRELNNEISAKRPSEYFAKLRCENTQLERAAAAQLIPLGPESGIETDDYPLFLQKRAELLLQEIGRVCGEITGPTEDERASAVAQLEDRLRSILHETLSRAAGDRYWKQIVPEAVRQEAEKRIAKELRQPGRAESEFDSPRARLDFCNVSEYEMIITNGNAWPHFAELFKSKESLQQNLRALSEYRNAVMHNRELTEYVRLGGERAMIWLRSMIEGTEQGITEEETPEPQDVPTDKRDAVSSTKRKRRSRGPRLDEAELLSQIEQNRGSGAAATARVLLEHARQNGLVIGMRPKSVSIRQPSPSDPSKMLTLYVVTAAGGLYVGWLDRWEEYAGVSKDVARSYLQGLEQVFGRTPLSTTMRHVDAVPLEIVGTNLDGFTAAVNTAIQAIRAVPAE